MLKEIIFISLLVTYSYAACDTSTTTANVGASGTTAGKCCYNGTTALPMPGVVTCTAGTGTSAAETAATGCAAGYYLSSGVCTLCAPANQYTAFATGATSVTATSCAACPLGSVVPAGTTAAPATSCTACGANTAPKADGTGCDARGTSATAITGCKVYETATGTNCVVAGDGYQTLTAAAASPLTACIANCKTCTGTTVALCSAASVGWYKNDATAPAIVACSADGLCAECTYTAGANPGAGKVSCTKAKAGAYLDKTVADAVVAKACPAGKGAPADNVGEAASCVACDATKFCGNCTAAADCSTCLPGYVLTARTATAVGTCAAFTGTKHASCDKANDTTESACQACVATQNREMEDDSASTTTPKAKLAVGKCVCKATFGDKSKITVAAGAAVDYVCEACGTNVLTCSFSATGVKKADTCATGFFAVGAECKAKDATDVNMAFFDTTTSTFKSCHASCQKCTGAAASLCTACPDAPSTWVEPTSSAANHATYIKGARALINGTCYSDCPTGWIANTARNSCVAGTAAGGSTGSASGVFAVLSLAISLFLIF